MSAHLIQRVTILGTGLIGGSFALALRNYTIGIRIAGWDRAEILRDARSREMIDDAYHGDLAQALRGADLVYIALPVGVTIDLLPEIARHAPGHALVTDACSTKMRIAQTAAEHFPANGPLFLPGHPMAGKEVSGVTNADEDLFKKNSYALISDASARPDSPDPRVSAFLKILEKMGARPFWIGAEQHDYAVGLASHLPQLAAVALGSFLYDRLDENGLPITLAGPGLRDTLRLAGSPYATWRDIILTNKEMLSDALDQFARRIDDLREKLGSRELEADFDSANELYRLLRGL
ncbi:MAG TPA: prephenate dehydrogenase [Candidatus Acidoferrum sp.]|nr:prephenate dehydrogenase [Candidatus Acidoferrum sp.]